MNRYLAISVNGGGALGIGPLAFMCRLEQDTGKKLGDLAVAFAGLYVRLFRSIPVVVLLLVPGLPGCLTAPSYVMFAVWLAIGGVFYVSRRGKIGGVE